VKLNKVTTEGVGTSFHLELTTAGETKVKKCWRSIQPRTSSTLLDPQSPPTAHRSSYIQPYANGRASPAGWFVVTRRARGHSF
jgi:hypothetical protein